MNIPATLKIGTRVRSHNKTHHRVAPLRTNTRSAEMPRTENKMRSNKSSSLTGSKPRLGESVRHSRHGNGEVLAHWPDGTLLVRFDNATKNRLVWPSFLDRVNGQRR